jgi:transcription antitermination factor NusG
VPILKREPDFLPETLFELPGDRFPWWVVHVRSRQEKVLARECRHREIPFYLPLREHRNRRDPRHRISWLPLFPGYVFVRGDLEHERLEVLKTNLCVRVLTVLDQEGLGHDLAQVWRLQQMGLPLRAHPELTRGSIVKIAEGPFEGMTGSVVSVKGKDRFVVSVRFIHRAVSVELGRDEIVPGEKRPEAPGPVR